MSDPYDAIYRGFRWQVPREFNWFEACCARWAREAPRATALVCEDEQGGEARFGYAELHAGALRVAAALAALGVARGDRVAIVMPQRWETAVAHMAVSALGAVAMPLSMLFGPDALAYRLRDSEASVNELTAALGASQQNVSKHLTVLAEAGIVGRRKEGTHVYYRIIDEGVFALCEQVCGSLEQQLGALNALVSGATR